MSTGARNAFFQCMARSLCCSQVGSVRKHTHDLRDDVVECVWEGRAATYTTRINSDIFCVHIYLPGRRSEMIRDTHTATLGLALLGVDALGRGIRGHRRLQSSPRLHWLDWKLVTDILLELHLQALVALGRVLIAEDTNELRHALINASTTVELQKQHEIARKIITQDATQRCIKFATANATAVHTANSTGRHSATTWVTGLTSFTFESEQTVTDAARNSKKIARELQGGEQVAMQKKSTLGVHHRLANHVYDHPYQTLATVDLPVVGSMFAYQNTNAAINTSLKIMHTRIYGQAAVVCIMAFHDYMSMRGRIDSALLFLPLVLYHTSDSFSTSQGPKRECRNAPPQHVTTETAGLVRHPTPAL